MGQPAARVGDMHVCPMVTPGLPPIPHVGGPILPPAGLTALIGGMPAARMGDMCLCVGPPDSILKGSLGVMIGGAPAARMGDPTVHGGSIVLGLPTVLIGDIHIGALSAIAAAVNPGGGTINCGNIIDAVVARLRDPDSTATAPTTEDGSWDEIEERFGAKFQWGQDFNQAYAAVEAGGPGTTALIGIEYADSDASHVVVMTNHDGHVAIIEGQGGGDVVYSSDSAGQAYGADSEVGVAILPPPATP